MLSPTWFNEQRRIGLGLTTLGVLLILVGTVLFFNRGLIALGNLMFLAGTAHFFMRRKNRKGSLFYLSGCASIACGWTLLGLLLEAYGLWRLFWDFLPTLLHCLRHAPLMGPVLDLPFINTASGRLRL